MKQHDTMTPAERRIFAAARAFIRSGRLWKTAARPWDRDETLRTKPARRVA